MESSPRVIRLALIANRFQRNDGQGRVNYEIARAALACGHQVTLLASYCADEIAHHPNARLIRVGNERLPTQLLRNLAFANDSARWLRKHRGEVDLVQGNGFITWERCDIIAAHFVHTAWGRNPFYPFAGFTLRPYALYQRVFTALNACWERRAFKSAAWVVAVSQMVAHEAQQLGVPADCIQIIGNGVDTDEFSPGTSDRASFNLPSGVPIALFAGDIRTPRKNLGTLLRALQSVAQLHLAVAGDTKDSPYPKLAHDLGVADRVHFLGKTPRIASLMRSVDLFIFPSRYESYGLVLLEAMASGLPAITSAQVGAAQPFHNCVAVLDDPDNVHMLTACIDKLLDSPELMKTMGEAGRQAVLAFSWFSTTAGYLSLYQSLLEASDGSRTHLMLERL